jgi:cholesterol oxidase
LGGLANMSTFEQLVLTACKGKRISFDETDIYPPHFNRSAIPISFVHGEWNECLFPESSEIEYKLLPRFNRPELNVQNALPSCGHIDWIFGKDAHRDLYPLMAKYLEGPGK